MYIDTYLIHAYHDLCLGWGGPTKDCWEQPIDTMEDEYNDALGSKRVVWSSSFGENERFLNVRFGGLRTRHEL